MTKVLLAHHTTCHVHFLHNGLDSPRVFLTRSVTQLDKQALSSWISLRTPLVIVLHRDLWSLISKRGFLVEPE